MKRKWNVAGIAFLVASLLLFLRTPVNGQIIVHGLVTELGSGEALVSASIYDTVSGTGTVSNEFGFYSLSLKSQSAVICYSFVGYTPVYLKLSAGDTAVSTGLTANNKLDEVTVIAADAQNDLSSASMSFHNISRMQLTKIPILLGETDMVKALQYLPGVSSGMEGTSGIYVRGGGADQNLILLDGVPVYNVNHLFGFFSVFNGEAVNSATLYKAGFPARYSGRLSSVIDVGLKEGNMEEFHGSVSVGLISSSLMLEGPVIKGKTSFMLSGRRTYADVVSYPVQYLVNLEDKYKSYIGYFFHDLNAKINHKFSDRSRLFLSTYMGKDEFYDKYQSIVGYLDSDSTYQINTREGFYWGNLSASLRWNYIWNSKLFSNAMVYWSKYRFATFKQYSGEFEYSNFGEYYTGNQVIGNFTSRNESYSGIKDLSALMNFNWTPLNSHQLRFGTKGSSYFYEPSVYEMKSDYEDIGSFNSSEGADTVLANSITVYLEDDFSLGKRFRSNIGVSSTLFQVQGKTYFALEPRIAASFMLTDNLALKASYSEMTQYIHLLSNSIIGLPTDVWVPTTKTLVPEESWQLAAGLHYQKRSDWKASMEVFYKRMENLVEYSEGKELLMSDLNWEEQVETGEGLAYGAELLLEKNHGKLTGSLAYTLSRNWRTFENLGGTFPYKYDKLHDLSLVMNYEFSDRISLGAVWVISSGVRTTILDQRYVNPFSQIYGSSESYLENFEVRNSYKMETFHRLDLGINLSKDKEHFRRTWSFGAYNAYNHLNPFYLYSDEPYSQVTGTSYRRVMSVTLFPLIPYFRYSITF